MDAILMRGQPYQTVLFRALAPVISTVHAVLTINGAPAVPGAAVTAARFVLGLNNGATWTVRLSSSPWVLQLLLITAEADGQRCSWFRIPHSRTVPGRLLCLLGASTQLLQSWHCLQQTERCLLIRYCAVLSQVYTSSAITVTLVGSSELAASAPFSGVIRAAAVTSLAAQVMLDAYAGQYATAGAVTHSVSVFRGTCVTSFDIPALCSANCHLPLHMADG